MNEDLEQYFLEVVRKNIGEEYVPIFNDYYCLEIRLVELEKKYKKEIFNHFLRILRFKPEVLEEVFKKCREEFT